MTERMALATNKTIVKVEVDTLQANPWQAELFGEPDPSEVEDLAQDMAKNGQLVSIEILPGEVLIVGHKRTAAAKLLGWTHLAAWVRADLAAQGDAAVQRRMIEDNLTRRQLDPLGLARCALRLKQLAMRRGQGRLSDREKGEVREEIGRRLGRSGRHIDRLIKVAELAPPAVQCAFSAGRLPLADACAVTRLRPPEREEIARRIAAGEDAKTVVRQFATRPGRRHQAVRHAHRAFVRALGRGLADLADRADQVPWVRPDEQITLQQAQKLITLLLARAQRQVEEDPRYAEALARLAGREEVEAAEAAGAATEGAAALPDTMSGPKKKRPKPRRARG
jgi:ParB-like chromosome segregation protein Spo0J